ncbi:MAG: formylglycine-generating enzyme family protein [Thermodesulfobacteriota bacterium]
MAGLRGLRGSSGLSVVGFPEGPDREAIPWARDRERARRRRPEPYRLPDPGTPILILGDCGCLAKRPGPWLAFGRRLKAAGFRPVALMPCPARYWDQELGQLFLPVLWDRQARLPRWLDAGQPRPEAAAPDPGLEQLLRLVAWAVRVEPGLLRALRFRLGASRADVGTEAAVWRHPDVRDDGPTCTIRPERLAAIRQQAVKELQEGGPEVQALYADAHRLLTAFHQGAHPTIQALEEIVRAQALAVPPAPEALHRLWQVAATLDRPGGYPYLARLQAWVLRMQERLEPAFWGSDTAEPVAIALATVKTALARRQIEIALPPGFDIKRVLWALGATGLQSYELRQEVTPQGERRLVLTPPGPPATDGPSGRGNILVAPLSLAASSLEWQHQDDAGPAGPVQVLDIRQEQAIPVPPAGRLRIDSDYEHLEIDLLDKPAWALRIEQGRSPTGEDRLILTPRDRPDRPLWWLPPADYPVLDRANRVVGQLPITEGRWVSSETYQELRGVGLRQPDWAQAIGQDQYGLFADWVYQGVTQRFRWIPPGQFRMGSPEDEPERWQDEGPRHEVLLTEGLWLADTACTQAMWQTVMGKNPSRFQGADRPVEKVSWNDVQRFLERINREWPGLELRLPSEAEWEYACRAGTETPFPFGTTITPEQVNYDGNRPYAGGEKGLYRQETVAVQALPANAWGLYQMHGNVWEWCADWYGAYPAGPVIDPAGPERGTERVLRGGCWIFYARRCRSALRYWFGPGSRFVITGFRLARGQTGKQAGR